jgi:hypothetical protein
VEAYPIFLSIVVSVQNPGPSLEPMLARINAQLEGWVNTLELIVVDNASTDDTAQRLKQLTSESGLPNIQAYILTQPVDDDTANWVGLENALGDFVAVLDPTQDDIGFLHTMLSHAVSGTDIVLATDRQVKVNSVTYRLCGKVFNAAYKSFTGIALPKHSPTFRILSKRVIHYILQHPFPAITYRHTMASSGFTRANLTYVSAQKRIPAKPLLDSMNRGIRLLVSTSHAPMRLVTALCLFGAASNILYSVYVIAIALFKADVAPGWVTLSLQQSGMFFLLSLVLWVLSEYLMMMTAATAQGPAYHVATEYTSALLGRRKRLNVEELNLNASHPIGAEPAVLVADR